MAKLDRLPTFDEDDVFHVVVESPRGSAIKLKYDPDLDAMSISRPLASGLVYIRTTGASYRPRKVQTAIRSMPSSFGTSPPFPASSSGAGRLPSFKSSRTEVTVPRRVSGTIVLLLCRLTHAARPA
jgi:hypothetical protein